MRPVNSKERGSVFKIENKTVIAQMDLAAQTDSSKSESRP